MTASEEHGQPGNSRGEQRPALDASGDDDADKSAMRVQARLRERRYFVALTAGVGVVMLLTIVIGVLVAVGGGDGFADLQPADWALVVGLPVGVLLLVAVVAGGLMVWRRRRGSALFAPSPLWELPTQAQRRKLIRALRRGQPIDPSQHDLARRVAHDITRRRGLVWLYVVVAAIQGANVVIQDGWARWLYIASALVFLGLAIYFFWLIRRMDQARQRFDDPATRDDLAANHRAYGAGSEDRAG